MGASYIAFSCLVALLVYWVPHVKRPAWRAALTLVIGGAAVAAGCVILVTYDGKTEMGLPNYMRQSVEPLLNAWGLKLPGAAHDVGGGDDRGD